MKLKVATYNKVGSFGTFFGTDGQSFPVRVKKSSRAKIFGLMLKDFNRRPRYYGSFTMGRKK